MSATFETYFSLTEIAQRIPKSADFWRAELKAGRFSPGTNGAPDLSNCVLIGGEYFVPASGIAYYLDTHKVGAATMADLVNSRSRQPAEAGAGLSAGITARSSGELRRKLSVQTSGQGGQS